ncbi:MAG: hypothetical protein PHW62_01655 [Candidatus Ratteibacteria bacterium]|nr:hypothetical protein [Candidatus Ratteibacteria bacterium]
MVKEKSGSNLLVPGLLVVVVIFGALLLFGGDKGTVNTGDVTGGGGTPTPTPPPDNTGATSTSGIKSGELELFLRGYQGGTGSTSTVILLDSSYAKFDTSGKYDEEATRYGIMAAHYNKGLTSLIGFPGKGTPKEISVSSGEWSEPQLVASKGDKFIVYSYKDTSPTASENVSTAHLMELKDFDVGSSKWVAQDTNGAAYWNLQNYGNNSWVDGSFANQIGYMYDDMGVAKSNVVITWYSYNTNVGEITKDGAIYIAARPSYTGKFKSLSVTDKNGHNKKFTTLTKAENYGGADPINIASTVLTSATTNYNWYYVGSIGNEMLTQNTASDKNRLTWELETDTYGYNETVNVTMVQNAGAIASSNGAFMVPDLFRVQVGNTDTAQDDSGWLQAS